MLTVLNKEDFDTKLQLKHWSDIVGDWDTQIDGKKWVETVLTAYEFYMQVYLPSRTKLGRYLDGQED